MGLVRRREERLNEVKGPGEEYLTRLGEELRKRGVKCELVTTGCAPRLWLDIDWPPRLSGFGDPAFEDHVLAARDANGRWTFWWPWIEPIGPADDLSRAADYLYRSTVGLIADESERETGSGVKMINTSPITSKEGCFDAD